MKLIKRKQYLDRLIKVMGTPDIKVITGVRRCGKSKLLESFKEYIELNIPVANIIHLNFNLPDFDALLSYKTLYEYVLEHYVEGKKNYVLIDEVQMCNGFERAINGLHAREQFDMYITGSNAFLLSSDLATLFTGRTFEIKVFPFSFAEYVQYFDIHNTSYALDKYVTDGGLSGSYLYEEQTLKHDYIADIFNTLIIRDIKDKYKIRNMSAMNKLVDYLMDNISNLSSERGITNALEATNRGIHHSTVGSYIEYLCNAFVFYRVRRYDIKGKRYFASNNKYYLSDHAFRYAKLGTKDADYGRVLENIVAIELLRRGYEVYVGVLYQKEIDFVALKRSEKIYIQVSASIDDKKVFEQEVSLLLQIKDAYPKLILANTKLPEYQYEGIRIIDIGEWLLGNNSSHSL